MKPKTSNFVDLFPLKTQQLVFADSVGTLS